MGIPIVTSIFPERGMLYISVFTMIDQLMLWTVGVRLTSKAEHSSFDFKKLINPVTVAIVLALIFILTGISLPEILNTAFSKIGATATPLAMIYLGGVFACMDMRKYICKLDYYGIVAIKMLIFPVLFYLLLGLLPISAEIRMTMTLKRIRHRRRLRHGRNPGDDSLLHCDTSVGILDFAIYLKRKSLTVLTKSSKSPASIGKSNKQ